MIKITKADQPILVESIVVTLYGSPGIGKSTLGYSASNPLLLDFDDGAKRAANRQDTVLVKSWSDIQNMEADDVADYDTIIIDTVGRCLDCITIDIIDKNSKMGTPAGQLSLQGYGVLASRFSSWIKMIKSFGKDVVLIAHATEDKNGDDLIERLDMQGKSKNEVYKASDAMGRMFVLNNKRFVDFRPGEAAFGKNPAEFAEPMSIGHYERNPHALADLITQIKESMNALTEDQRDRMAAIDNWRQKVEKLTTVEQVNQAVNEAKELPDSFILPCKAILADHAKTLGLVFDKGAGAYTTPEQQPEKKEPTKEHPGDNDPDDAPDIDPATGHERNG